ACLFCRPPVLPSFPTRRASDLSAWRALYFKPGQATPVTTDDPDVQRGHYLVEVAGHCTACHTPRNRWGATDLARSLQGAVMPDRSEEHTSELQSRANLVCRLLL